MRTHTVDVIVLPTMTTIRDVARTCGVSTATVSNVLNNTGRPVHPRTRALVLEAAQRLSYHPSAIARSLTGQSLQTIGVLFGVIEPEVITNPYAVAVLQGILTTAAENQYNVTLWTIPWHSAEESASRFRDRRTDGTIVVAPPLNRDIVSGLAAIGLPMVVVSSQTVPDGVAFIDVDNEQGLYLATKHVIELGHTHIAHMSGDENQPSFAARRAGFLRAMQETGLPVPEENLVTSWYIVDRARKDALALLSRPNRPTAVVTGSDNTACGILEAARELGIRVPEDLSVTGFDDIPPASMITPRLTTVRQPLVEIGGAAAQTLLHQIEGRTGCIQSKVVAPSLIVRESTAMRL